MFFFSAAVCAAQGIIVPRHLLDSIAEPPLEHDAALLFEDETLCTGDIKEDEDCIFKFEFRNVSDSSVTITRISPSCGCLSVNYPWTVAGPGETGHIEVKYSPFGHVGHFRHRIYVYTGISTVRPAVKLEISGNVVPDSRTGYPVAMGPLRLKRSSVSFGEVFRGTVREERIACMNAGTGEMLVRAFRQMCPVWIDVRTEPAVLAPGAEGDIIVSIDSARLPKNIAGIVRTSVILDGIEGRPSQRSITVEAVVVPPSGED